MNPKLKKTVVYLIVLSFLISVMIPIINLIVV